MKQNKPIQVFAVAECYIHERRRPAGSEFLYYGSPEDLTTGYPLMRSDCKEAAAARAQIKASSDPDQLPWINRDGRLGVVPMMNNSEIEAFAEP